MISGPTKMNNQVNLTGKNVIDLQIKALKKLKNSIDNVSFYKAVRIISKCKSDKPEIIEEIQSTGKLDEDKEKLLVEIITQLKGTFKS